MLGWGFFYYKECCLVQQLFVVYGSATLNFRRTIDMSVFCFGHSLTPVNTMRNQQGQNPELRMMFFRCSKLLEAPFLPIFVFDGPNRPQWKRGKRVKGNQNWMTNGAKDIIAAFGFESHDVRHCFCIPLDTIKPALRCRLRVRQKQS